MARHCGHTSCPGDGPCLFMEILPVGVLVDDLPALRMGPRTAIERARQEGYSRGQQDERARVLGMVRGIQEQARRERRASKVVGDELQWLGAETAAGRIAAGIEATREPGEPG